MSFWLFCRGLRARAAALPVFDVGDDADGGAISFAVPPCAAGAWCRLRATVRASGPFWVKLELVEDGPTPIVRQRFLGPARRARGRAWRESLVYVPRGTGFLAVRLFGGGVALDRVGLDVLSRPGAAWRLFWHGMRALPEALRGDAMGVLGRVRAALGGAPARRGEAPPYPVWLDLYDTVHDREGSGDRFGEPIRIVVLGAGAEESRSSPPSAAMRASLASIAAQSLRAADVITIYKASDWVKCPPGPTVLLQAGETLHPAALARLARAAGKHPAVLAFYAELDHVDAHGARHSPRFKPGPDPLLLRDGVLTAGAMLFRRFDPQAQTALHADEARLAVSLALGASRIARVPALLTHRRWDMELPDPARIAELGGKARPRREAHGALVTIIIPSSGRSAHMLRCLRRVIRATRYERFEILLAVTRIDPADGRQAAILRHASRLAHTRVLDLCMEVFNYATANNRAAAAASGFLLLLLNDDVAPIQADWLDRMVSYFAEPDVGIVGARLLYGNRTVQHGGVLLGLAGLCEHIDKGRPAAWPGPGGMATRSRTVSAVTAACMLVRRDVFEKLQGLDQGFAIALNDVDFCLRAAAAGLRCVYAADAVLYHYESLSLGRHYAGARAALEGTEISLLRGRWAGLLASDPFYSPNASLEPGREWQPAFPPLLPGRAGPGRSDADGA